MGFDGKIIARLLMAITVIVGLPFAAPAAELVVGYAAMRPHFDQTPTGDPSGDVLLAVLGRLNQLGHRVIAAHRPAARVRAELASGKIDLGFGPPIRAHGILVSARPIWRTELELLWEDGMEPYSSVRSLYGRKVAALRGYSLPGVEAILESPGYQVDLYRVNSAEQGLRMLRAGRVEYLIAYRRLFADMNQGMLIGTHRKVIGTTSFHLLARSELPEARSILNNFDQDPLDFKPDESAQMKTSELAAGH